MEVGVQTPEETYVSRDLAEILHGYWFTFYATLD
jgi:hypothetical protein